MKHNTYFDGKVQSIGFERHGRKQTVGVVDPGEFHFNTDAAERMTVVAGELLAKLAGSSQWLHYPAGTAFEIPAKSGFDVKAIQASAYVCEFL
ncbi:MAG: pyrimidine/purine nucleoside phosphorylase [Planctomycetes bacterium]|nr:pyrimidine/purine nucleoside phosphorylase [Planctomycetota bacterium]